MPCVSACVTSANASPQPDLNHCAYENVQKGRAACFLISSRANIAPTQVNASSSGIDPVTQMVQHDSGALWPKFLLGHGRLPLGLFAPSTDPDSNYANSMAVSSLGGKCALPLDNAAINQIIGLSIVPSVILLVLAFVRYCRLFNQPVKVQPGFIFFVKLVNMVQTSF